MKQNLQFSPPARGPAVVEVIDHEEGVGLEPLNVVQVVADGARERRLADLLELLLGEPTAGVCLGRVFVPEVQHGKANSRRPVISLDEGHSPKPVSLSEVEELLADDASKGRPDDPTDHRPLRESAREKVNVVHVVINALFGGKKR